MTAPDREQAKRHFDRWFRESAISQPDDYLWLNRFREMYQEHRALAAQLAEAQEQRDRLYNKAMGWRSHVLEVEAQLSEAQERERIEEVNAQSWKTRAEDAEAQLAERERALERIRLAAGYETEDEDLRLAEVRSIVRAALAALDSTGGAER